MHNNRVHIVYKVVLLCVLHWAFCSFGWYIRCTFQWFLRSLSFAAHSYRLSVFFFGFSFAAYTFQWNSMWHEQKKEKASAVETITCPSFSDLAFICKPIDIWSLIDIVVDYTHMCLVFICVARQHTIKPKQRHTACSLQQFVSMKIRHLFTSKNQFAMNFRFDVALKNKKNIYYIHTRDCILLYQHFVSHDNFLPFSLVPPVRHSGRQKKSSLVLHLIQRN